MQQPVFMHAYISQMFVKGSRATSETQMSRFIFPVSVTASPLYLMEVLRFVVSVYKRFGMELLPSCGNLNFAPGFSEYVQCSGCCDAD